MQVDWVMQVSARVNYGLRAMVELAHQSQQTGADWISADELAQAQQIPEKYLEAILNELRRAGLILSKRGGAGGYRLARPADEITFADVIKALESRRTATSELDSGEAEFPGPAIGVRDVWLAVRAAMHGILEAATLADMIQRPPAAHGAGSALVVAGAGQGS